MIAPLLAIAALSPAARAEEPVVDAGAAPATTLIADAAALAARLDTLHRQAGQTVLVAAAGPQAEELALSAVASLPAAAARVSRVGYLGEPAKEVERALAVAGLRCAARVGPADGGAYTLNVYGTCTPAPAGAFTAGASAGGAPAPTTPAGGGILYTPGPVMAPDPAVLESTYKLASLRREPVVRDDQLTWIVRDGRGMQLDAAQFAKRTGDLGVERQLGRARATSSTLGWGLGVAGGTMVVASLGVLASRNGGEPDRGDYDPSPLEYTTTAEYLAAIEQADADYDAAERAWDIKREDRAWAAGFLAAGGLLALGVAPFAAQGAEAGAAHPALWWEAERADALITAYNASLRGSLGLAAAEAPPAPAPPDADVPDDLDDLERDDLERDDLEQDDLDHDELPEPPDDASGGPPAPEEPTGDLPSPSPTPQLRLRPVLAPGWAGVQGRF